jgi:hypothetical protein
VTLERSARGATQDFNSFNDVNHNPVVPGILTTNVYKDLAVRFIHNPKSNVVMTHTASEAGIGSGRLKVRIELENDDAI